MPWDRRLWGVRLVDQGRAGGLLGPAWSQSALTRYDGEPPRALLFRTRQLARAWCQRQRAFYAKYPHRDACRTWRFQAVRVRERVTAIRRGA